MKRICGYIFVFYMFLSILDADNCPEKCICKGNNQGNGSHWIKVRCGGGEKLESLDDINFLDIAKDIIQLNLSDNDLTTFMFHVHLDILQKLDLSKNHLATLEANQFEHFPNLRKLDLSNNFIRQIDILAFVHLRQLERLKLNQNNILTISNGTFESLVLLKQLDLAGNPLKCDCELLWLLAWCDRFSVKLTSNPKCESPHQFVGRPLRKVRVGEDLHCRSPAKNRDLYNSIVITPEKNQVVFEGDSLKLQCRAPIITERLDAYETENKDHIDWYWLDHNPNQRFEDVKIVDRFLDNGFIDSSLTINNLNRNHTGQWSCRLSSHDDKRSKVVGIKVIVVSNDTTFCQSIATTNNKGTYVWPRSVSNNTVSLPCEISQESDEKYSTQEVTHFCNEKGEWSLLNMTQCPYFSETTKILEQFSKVNFSLVKSNILDSALRFKNYTSDVKAMKDIMDVVFIGRTIMNYLQVLSNEQQLGSILLDVINSLLSLEQDVLLDAENEDETCTKIQQAVETIAYVLHYSPGLLQKSQIAVQDFPVKFESFNGLTCTWYITKENEGRLFHCLAYNPSATSATLSDREIEASIQLPPNLFEQILGETRRDIPSYVLDSPSLLIAMYASNKLFPIRMMRQQEVVQEVITSPVVGVKFRNVTVMNLTDPVYVMLKTSQRLASTDTSSLTPVWWNPHLHGGKGDWTAEGCQLSHEIKDTLVFSCRQLGYYGLLQDISNALWQEKPGAKFRFSHPAIYVGSFILFVCFLFSIMTYLFCYAAIQIPRKTKHSLINTWTTMALLCFVYVCGIYQTEDIRICRTIGLSLHYFTLSSLLWMCVGVNTMYKRLRKQDVKQLQDDELPIEKHIQKPILGLYLLGWGIGLIICGISGAVNIQDYSRYDRCFLNSAPALSALYIPCILLLFVLIIYFIIIRCVIYNNDSNGHLSEGTQATENVDLDLLEPNFPQIDNRSMRSYSTKTPSSKVEDAEHAPMTQLKAYIIFLGIYLLCWISCALATIKPIKIISYEEDLFSIIYAVVASLLGLFTLFFYCIARSDVRSQWMLTLLHLKRKKSCFRSHHVSDTIPCMPQIQIQSLPPLQQTLSELHGVTRSSSRSSAQTKSLDSNALKVAATNLNTAAFLDNAGTKINNVILVDLHYHQYTNGTPVPNIVEYPSYSAEMFYNPYQMAVARRFFRKQRRNMLRHNNLAQTRRYDLNNDNAVALAYSRRPKKDNSSVDTSILNSNSKVNNKNIHVKKVRKHKSRKRDLNVLDSSDELNSLHVDKVQHTSVRKKDLGRQKWKKRSNINGRIPDECENNMRSVSQQCTLEYSSEPLSDSILDRNTPIILIPAQDSFNTEISEAVPSTRRENSPIGNVSLMPRQHYYDSNNLVQANANVNICRSLNISAAVDSGSELNEPRIYVNPSHDLYDVAKSQASSVSASEIDELYQQIKRGPHFGHSYSQRHIDRIVTRQGSPCLSDSEINSYLGTNRQAKNRYYKRKLNKDETPV